MSTFKLLILGCRVIGRRGAVWVTSCDVLISVCGREGDKEGREGRGREREAGRKQGRLCVWQKGG